MLQTTTGSPLLSLTALRADFKSGQTPLGHHWRLSDADGNEAGRTKRLYQGAGGKIGRRLAVVTGLSTAGTVTIEISDGAGSHVATLRSEGGARTRATLETPDGTPIGAAHHDAERGVVELLDAADRVVGRILAPAGDEQPATPFPIVDAAGEPIGRLSRDPQALIGPSVSAMILDLGPNTTNYEAELAKHYGFRHSHTYAVTLDPPRPLPQPLATLAILAPVFAAYLY
ncbi:MAG: hypothetical protein ACJ762_10200 [Solirubrobacteraceae bacterium]